MKFTVTVEVQEEVEFLDCDIGVRYWEDGEVNGQEDSEGDKIPCRKGDNWCPVIGLHSGQIINWEDGKSAKVHYKVCDNGAYKLLDKNMQVVKEIEGYVPSMLAIDDNGYGDYVIMEIDKKGFIKNFKVDLSEFEIEKWFRKETQ